MKGISTNQVISRSIDKPEFLSRNGTIPLDDSQGYEYTRPGQFKADSVRIRSGQEKRRVRLHSAKDADASRVDRANMDQSMVIQAYQMDDVRKSQQEVNEAHLFGTRLKIISSSDKLDFEQVKWLKRAKQASDLIQKLLRSNVSQSAQSKGMKKLVGNDNIDKDMKQKYIRHLKEMLDR